MEDESCRHMSNANVSCETFADGYRFISLWPLSSFLGRGALLCLAWNVFVGEDEGEDDEEHEQVVHGAIADDVGKHAGDDRAGAHADVKADKVGAVGSAVAFTRCADDGEGHEGGLGAAPAGTVDKGADEKER